MSESSHLVQNQQAPSILICDDSVEEIRVLVSYLKSANYRLIIATDGKDAIDRASILQPQLILLDVRMPRMDGFSVCRLLKAHADTKDIPVIFLTAANDTSSRIAGLRLGAVDYIVKPASEEEVLLRAAIHLSEIHQEPLSFDPEGLPREKAAVAQACVRMLDEDLSQSPSTQDLADQLGCSKRFLNESFRTVFNCTVYEWLRERRMQQAKTLLSHSSIPINDIALDLGFSSSSNFATAFRERFGHPPRVFRKGMQHSPEVRDEEECDSTANSGTCR